MDGALGLVYQKDWYWYWAEPLGGGGRWIGGEMDQGIVRVCAWSLVSILCDGKEDGKLLY